MYSLMEEKSGRLLLAMDSPNFLINNILALKNIHVKFFLFIFLLWLHLDFLVVNWDSARHSINTSMSSPLHHLAWGIPVTRLRTSAPRCPVYILTFCSPSATGTTPMCDSPHKGSFLSDQGT